MTSAIRPFRNGDGAACYDVYFVAVRNGTAPAYTAEQARAWAPTETDDGEWTHRLADGLTWVAEGRSQLYGFITLRQDGHLDLFFVRPEASQHGTAAALYDTLLNEARALGMTRLFTHASHLARSFLERRGWRVLEEQDTTRNGVRLTRFRMELAPIGPSDRDGNTG